MQPLRIEQVTTRRQRREFVTMPWRLYRQDPHWVPPLVGDQMEFLDPKRGVFFDHGQAALFLARRDGQAVGRISAHVDRNHDRIHGAGKGFFGFFECENNLETACGLTREAAAYLRALGRTHMEGPLSFGVYDEVGMLVEGFESDPYVMNVHNHPYYRELMEGCGFAKAIDWYAYRGLVDHGSQVNPKLFAVRDRVLRQSGFRLREIDLGKVHRESAIIQEIFAQAWSENWGHVPLTDREFARLTEAVKRIAIPQLSFIAEMDGRPVGFALSIYDANAAVKKVGGRLFPFGFITFLRHLKRTDRFRHILMGVLEEYRGRGIEITFYASIVERAASLGFRELEMSLILENNVRMRNSLKHFPVNIYKVYRIYRKDL